MGGGILARIKKKIEKLRNNPRNASREDVISILLSLDYKEEGGSGSHRCFRHPLLPGRPLTIPMKIYTRVVKQVLESIDQLLEQTDYEI